MTDKTAANESLDAVTRARQRAQTDSRWFPWACVVVGLLAIPGGIVVPWSTPNRFIALLIVWVLVVTVIWLMGRMPATPRGGKRALNIAIACWFALNAIVAAVGNNIENLWLGLAFSTLASVPFFVAAMKFRSSGNDLK